MNIYEYAINIFNMNMEYEYQFNMYHNCFAYPENRQLAPSSLIPESQSPIKCVTHAHAYLPPVPLSLSVFEPARSKLAA